MQTGNRVFSSVAVESRQKVDIRPGDTVRVWQKVEEKGKTRLQPFEGVVLARKHGTEPGATFTVRRVSGGYGVEKIFPLYSPMIDKIEITKRARMRRAKLYHIRDKAAREIRRQMRNMRFVNIATESDTELENSKAEKVEKAEDAEEKPKQEQETTTDTKVVEEKAEPAREEDQEQEESS